MSEANKQVIRKLIEELWNKGNLDAIDELYAPDFVDSSPGMPPEIPTDREGAKQFVTMFRAAYPDIKGTIKDELADGDKVVVRWEAHATHEGDFMGIPATGKKVTVTGTSIYRLSGGKVAEEWTHADMLSLMGQIGAIPEMAGT